MVRNSNDDFAAHSMGPTQLPPAYNLFRQTDEPHLHCAVAQDKPVPVFILSETWEFVRSGPATKDVPGFTEHHARMGDFLMGFYLFQSWSLATPVAETLKAAA